MFRSLWLPVRVSTAVIWNLARYLDTDKGKDKDKDKVSQLNRRESDRYIRIERITLDTSLS